MDIMMEEKRKESNVGKKLTDFTLRKVIFIVLLMLFTNPLFMIHTYEVNPESMRYGIDLLVKTNINVEKNSNQKFMEKFIQTYLQ